jgi:hypothetical protein
MLQLGDFHLATILWLDLQKLTEFARGRQGGFVELAQAGHLGTQRLAGLALPLAACVTGTESGLSLLLLHCYMRRMVQILPYLHPLQRCSTNTGLQDECSWQSCPSSMVNTERALGFDLKALTDSGLADSPRKQMRWCDGPKVTQPESNKAGFQGQASLPLSLSS